MYVKFSYALIHCKVKIILQTFPNITEDVTIIITAAPIFSNDTIETKSSPNMTIHTYNNAEWLGFHKTDKNHSLPHLVRWNIVYILAVTLWAVVLVRQFNFRVSRGKPTTRPYFMFPSIRRSDADKNLINCLKYLFNYSFYKFGVEVNSDWPLSS